MSKKTVFIVLLVLGLLYLVAVGSGVIMQRDDDPHQKIVNPEQDFPVVAKLNQVFTALTEPPPLNFRDIRIDQSLCALNARSVSLTADKPTCEIRIRPKRKKDTNPRRGVVEIKSESSNTHYELYLTSDVSETPCLPISQAAKLFIILAIMPDEKPDDYEFCRQHSRNKPLLLTFPEGKEYGNGSGTLTFKCVGCEVGNRRIRITFPK